MPIDTPTPPPAAPSPAAAKATADKAKADLKAREVKTQEFKDALGAAQSAVAAAWGDVKSLTDAGQPAELVVLTAAIDDQTKAVGDITAHGSRFAWVADDVSKALRDAHHTLTQAYSDLRTVLEFGSGAADQSALPVVLANMDAAVSGVASAAKS
jgi:xanthine dehydrogenase molybdopterin-binding subunit B